MSVALSALSTEYIKVKIVVTKLGIAVDPTSDTVQFAFPVGLSANPSVWYAASWETVTDTLGNKSYYARCLVGPTGGVVALPVGNYSIWVKVTDAPEVPVLDAGTLLIN